MRTSPVSRFKGTRRNTSTAHPGGGSSRWGLAVLIVLVSAYVQTQSSGFISESNIQIIILNVSSLLIAAAAAMRLVVSGNVDLSIGGQFSLLSVLAALVARDTGSAALAVLAVLVGGLCLGLVNGAAVRVLSISPLIVTLGLSFVYFGLANAMSKSQAIFGLPDSFLQLGLSSMAGVPTPVWVSLIFFAFSSLVLTRTVGGIRRFAIGGDATACRSEGINVERALLADFAFMGLAMGVVASLATARVQSGTADIGVNFELEVLTAVIVGGVAFNGGAGRPLGVFLGVVLLGTIDAAMVFLGFADYFQQIAKGAILLMALAADQYARHRSRVTTTTGAADRASERATESDGREIAERRLDTPPCGTVAVRVRDVSKNYGAVQALRDISFDIRYGEVTCLLGDNGAGKSSLIKVLAGAVKPSEGEILVNREDEPDLRPTDDPRAAGIETVWQDLAICRNLGAAYNLALGNEPVTMGLGPVKLFDRRAAERSARARLGSIGVNLTDMFRPLADLSGGQRQSVSISRVVSEEVRIVVLDEPTAALGVHQTRNVVKLIRDLADAGAAVLLVSHDIGMVRELADHYVILNRGRLVADERAEALSARRLVQLMAGLEDEVDESASEPMRAEL